MAHVLVCTEFDTGTGECVAEQWQEMFMLPDMSYAEAQIIGGAIAMLWITAFLLRWLRKQSESL